MYLILSGQGDLVRSSATHENPDIVDSFRVEDGQIVNLDRHWRRFAASALQRRPEIRRRLGLFIDQVRDKVVSLNGFHRIEFYEKDSRLALWIREVETDCEQAVVWVGDAGDRRCRPWEKGPDLNILRDYAETAQQAGADSFLIRDDSGAPLEGEYAALAWWDTDRLYLMPRDERRLPSITDGWLAQAATQAGLDVQRQQPDLATLLANETWLLNAKYGIRRVVEWRVGEQTIPGTKGSDNRFSQWRRAWYGAAKPVTWFTCTIPSSDAKSTP